MSKVYVPVSVKDELPPEGQWVFIFVEVLGEMVGKHYAGIWKALYADGLRNCDPEDTVTHWLKDMEVPDPVRIKLSVADLNPYREKSIWWNAWNRGLIEGIKSVLNLLTPNNNEAKQK